MHSHRLSQTYNDTFQAFLKHTNEKQILFDRINQRIAEKKIRSLLDIGAGNGLLSIPIARSVKHYLAVEARESYVQMLRDTGLEVVHAVFPCVIDDQFDMVLASHSSPWKPEDYQPFIRAAMENVRYGGTLLLITYNDVESEWTDLLRSSNLEVRSQSVNRLDVLKTWFVGLGMTTTRIITTHVTTETIEEMMRALAFVYSDGIPARIEEFYEASERIVQHLGAHYRDKDSYRFPFNHVLFEVSKINEANPL